MEKRNHYCIITNWILKKNELGECIRYDESNSHSYEELETLEEAREAFEQIKEECNREGNLIAFLDELDENGIIGENIDSYEYIPHPIELVINSNRERDVFGYSTIRNIAESIINRIDNYDIDEDGGNLTELISDSVDDELIYTSDQWEIIEYYSTPNNPRSLSDCMDEFISDIESITELQ